MDVRKEGEAGALNEFLAIIASRNEHYTARYAASFGHLDEDLQVQIMYNVRLGIFSQEQEGLQRVLEEGMVIVPGDNSISKDQIQTLNCAYVYNRQTWDPRIDSWIEESKK